VSPRLSGASLWHVRRKSSGHSFPY
jgi:hypothetical protein